MSRDELAYLDGKLYIVNTDTDSRDPIIRRLYWTVLRTSGWIPCWFAPDSSGEYCHKCGQPKQAVTHNINADTLKLGGYDGRYGGCLANGARYQIEIDPRAHAVKIEESPIPQPKVRSGIETRYRAGRWEKFLKSSGWVAA